MKLGKIIGKIVKAAPHVLRAIGKRKAADAIEDICEVARRP